MQVRLNSFVLFLFFKKEALAMIGRLHRSRIPLRVNVCDHWISEHLWDATFMSSKRAKQQPKSDTYLHALAIEPDGTLPYITGMYSDLLLLLRQSAHFSLTSELWAQVPQLRRGVHLLCTTQETQHHWSTAPDCNRLKTAALAIMASRTSAVQAQRPCSHTDVEWLRVHVKPAACYVSRLGVSCFP